jgi:type IV pilus assembly protein PilA
MQEREWFYVEAGVQRGPYTAAEVVEVVRRLGPATLVWRAGLEGWVRAEAVPELARPPGPAITGGPPRIPSPALPARDGEPHTLNPLVLWRRCFAWSGRFTRSEFAVAHLGFVVVGLVVFGVGAALMAAAGDKNKGAWIAIGLFALVWIPIAFIVSVGSTVRRLHDLGQSGWLALVSFVPCVSLVFLVYLLAAQGREGVAPPASSTIPVGVVVGVVAAVVLVLVVPIIGIVAAIAIPSLLRARIAANEASAIGNVRTVISAEAAYQTVNQGFYDGRGECLSGPQTCIPDYTGPTFIDAALFAGPRSGYVHELQGGAPAAAAKGISPSSTDAFAVIAYPAAAGKTGVRAFCGDATGRVCAVASGSREELVAGSPGQSDIRCADACRELR